MCVCVCVCVCECVEGVRGEGGGVGKMRAEVKSPWNYIALPLTVLSTLKNHPL